jgi:sterol desaturase/sphingolipid hydroxylase (fatty acid hydroxylase superfamily)
VPVDLILLLLSPIFFLFIGFEWYVTVRRRLAVYQWRDSLANLLLAAMHQAGDVLALLLILPLWHYLYQFALFPLEFSWQHGLLLFFLQDFLYYWFHRSSHGVRWLWASHVVHHSSRLMNFSTAFRQSLTYQISGMWLFWTPLVLLGFSPGQVLAAVALNLAFQFFVHTRWGRHWGWLGLILNTPAWHRVHHACNAPYLDRNFGGVLIIWDRLFGTFTPEHADIPCQYGITDDFCSVNPLEITLFEWRRMWRDWRKARGFAACSRALLGRPYADLPWQSMDAGANNSALSFDTTRVKRD